MSQPATSPTSRLHHSGFSVRGLPASIAWYQKVFEATLTEGTLPHCGREWSGYAEQLIEPCTGAAAGLQGLEAWGDWPGSLGVAHSGIQSKKEPFVYSTIGFRDLDNIQLEFAIDV